MGFNNVYKCTLLSRDICLKYSAVERSRYEKLLFSSAAEIACSTIIASDIEYNLCFSFALGAQHILWISKGLNRMTRIVTTGKSQQNYTPCFAATLNVLMQHPLQNSKRTQKTIKEELSNVKLKISLPLIPFKISFY